MKILSRRKRMSTIHDLPDQAATDRIAGTRHWVVYLKGAPKEILDLCTTVELNGSQRPLNPAQREQIIAANDNYARDGLRVLAIARRLLDSGQYRQEESRMDYSPESIEQNLTFLGLVAMMDPPRPEVTEAVQQCHRAGIRVVMITGDYGLTAESIARKIGIVYWGQFLGLPSSGPLYRSATAMALAAVVTTQIGNLFAQRSERTSVFRLPWFKNRLIWAGIATELTLIALIVYAPGLQNFIGTAAFPLSNWAFLFAWTPALLLVDEVRKWFVRRRIA